MFLQCKKGIFYKMVARRGKCPKNHFFCIFGLLSYKYNLHQVRLEFRQLFDILVHPNQHTLAWYRPSSGPLGPQKGQFWPQMSLLGTQRSQEGPRGQNLVLTATGCSARVKLMVATHFDLVSALFWAPNINIYKYKYFRP